LWPDEHYLWFIRHRPGGLRKLESCRGALAKEAHVGDLTGEKLTRETAFMKQACIVGLSLWVAWGILTASGRGEEEVKNRAVVPTSRTGAWVSRHEGINSAARLGTTKLLFLGDSITQAWETKGEIDAIWQKYYVPRRALNAGISGDRTQNVLWRLQNGNIDGIKPKLAVLMIGTNNSADNTSEQIAEGIKAIVAVLREKLPDTKILLLAIFPRGPDADEPRRKGCRGVNEIIQKLADDKSLFYLDIGKNFLQEDGELTKEIMPDFLHLSPKGYQIWADAMEAKVAELLVEKK